MADRVLATSKYLELVERDGWYFVHRPNIPGVVTIIALTPSEELVFVEQIRKPVGGPTIELPAGLAGDEDANEDLAEAARRELFEETGFWAGRVEPLPRCASSPGLTTELVSFFLATDLDRRGTGGGVGDENIHVHLVPLRDASSWLAERSAQGFLVAAKVYAGLFFAHEHVQTKAPRSPG